VRVFPRRPETRLFEVSHLDVQRESRRRVRALLTPDGLAAAADLSTVTRSDFFGELESGVRAPSAGDRPAPQPSSRATQARATSPPAVGRQPAAGKPLVPEPSVSTSVSPGGAPTAVEGQPGARTAPSPPVVSPPRAAARGSIRPERPSPPTAQETPVPAAAPSTQPTAEVLRLALYYHRAGDFDRAQAHYRALLDRDELDPQAHNNLGLLFRDRGMLDQAVQEFRRALIIDEEYLTARNNLGVALLGQSRLDEASAAFKRVLAREPRNVDASVNLALVEKAAGQPERAKESLLRALMLEPRNAPAHFNLAAIYEQTGERLRAVEHYRAFLQHAGAEHAARAADARARIEALSDR
jgi:Tfp pilus assembly protein PilF